MKYIFFVLLLIFAGTAFANDCSSITQQILSSNELSEATAKDVMFGKEKMDGKKIKSKREALVKKFVYSGPYFDNIDDDVNYFLDMENTFTGAKEYFKGKTRLRVFEEKTKKSTLGYALEMGANKRVLVSLNPDCSVKEGIYIDDGTRCYMKARDCENILPLTGKKLKEQCSYLNDTSATAVTAATRACNMITTKLQEKSASDNAKKEVPKKSAVK